jgi:hypothetical protein
MTVTSHGVSELTQLFVFHSRAPQLRDHAALPSLWSCQVINGAHATFCGKSPPASIGHPLT